MASIKMGITWSLLGLARNHFYESGAIFDVQPGCEVKFWVVDLWGKETQYQGEQSNMGITSSLMVLTGSNL